MEYPLISEYREAIMAAEDNFNELSSLRPVLDSHGYPVLSSGNFAVIFKMRDENDGKLYAVKCFIKDQEGRNESYRKISDELEIISSSYILPLRYLENELFVDTAQCDREEFPVVVMEWIEGETLDAYLNRNLNDKYELEMLSYRFNRMSAWLLAQPFAHGDLKPDNILVRKDGTLVLVDYDGMFVPSMKGEKAREIGSPDYRHPSRTDADFDEHIDDFSIAVIALSLKAIALNPNLKSKTTNRDTLYFSEQDFCSPQESEPLKALINLANNSDLDALLGIFYIALAKNSLEALSFRLFITSIPKQLIKSKTNIREENKIDTSCTNTDISEGITDEFGCIYSKDGKRLLKFKNNCGVSNYSIKPGTIVICDNSFGREFIEFDVDNIGIFLLSITIPNSVIAIGCSAFSGCPHLQEIDIPDSVISIGNNAFSGCLNLQEIVIPSIVISIGNEAFSGCTSLKRITIPNTITKIQTRTFFECQSLKSITLPNSLTQICDKAFYGCKDLLNVNLPETINIIGENAFSGCSKLKSINLPESLIDIDGNPFNGCDNLEIVMPSISNFIIRNQCLISKNGTLIACLDKKVLGITIPNSVVSIAKSAFIGCKDLVTVNVPESVTSIGDSAFRECKNLNYLKIPESVISIGNYAFCGCTSLKLILIPKSITSIGDHAFDGCNKLIGIKIPESVISIGYGAFSGCKSLHSMTIPKSVKYIGGNAFSTCKSLQSVKIPDSVTEIGNAAFSGCESLQNINIPESVTFIGNNTFSECKSLQSVNIPDSVTAIGDAAFSGCESLQNINIPGSVSSIGNNALSECKSLESVNIPSSVTYIGDYAFYHCESLRNANIPESVTTFGHNPFAECPNISILLSVKSKFKLINGLLMDNNGRLICCISKESDIDIPSTVTAIDDYAFSSCGPLKVVNIPDSVTSIGDNAFFGCYSLVNVNIPKSVTIIGNYAFECTSLVNVKIPRTTWINRYSFPEDCKIISV